jgi:MoaA/NifB/PqqE/SkfB family radical SAM enzyme
MDSRPSASRIEPSFHDLIGGVIKEPIETHGRFVHTAFPQQLVVELTSACNQGCIFCGRTYMERQKSHMARPLFDRIAEEIGRESPYTELWPAFMGESMLLGDELFERLAFARRAGCQKITPKSARAARRRACAASTRTCST